MLLGNHLPTCITPLVCKFFLPWKTDISCTPHPAVHRKWPGLCFSLPSQQGTICSDNLLSTLSHVTSVYLFCNFTFSLSFNSVVWERKLILSQLAMAGSEWTAAANGSVGKKRRRLPAAIAMASTNWWSSDARTLHAEQQVVSGTMSVVISIEAFLTRHLMMNKFIK